MLTDAVETVEGSRNNAHLKMITTTGQILNTHLSVWKCALDGGGDSVRLNHWNRAWTRLMLADE